MKCDKGKGCENWGEGKCCFGHSATDTYCDWFPRKFRERSA